MVRKLEDAAIKMALSIEAGTIYTESLSGRRLLPSTDRGELLCQVLTHFGLLRKSGGAWVTTRKLGPDDAD
jgi:hypothetical protein